MKADTASKQQLAKLYTKQKQQYDTKTFSRCK